MGGTRSRALTRGFLIEKRLLTSRIPETGSCAFSQECGFKVGSLGSGGISEAA
jgi:hypothetical protein